MRAESLGREMNGESESRERSFGEKKGRMQRGYRVGENKRG